MGSASRATDTSPTLLFDGLPHQIHHQTPSRNTPVLRTIEPPAQTTQTKKSDALKIGSSVGTTCLGEYTPFLLIDSLPREKASIGSKKRKLLPSKISMELDLDDEEPLTAPPRSNINPSNPWTHAQPLEHPQHHEAALPPRAQRPTPRTQCPTPRAQCPTPRTQCPTTRANTPCIGSYTNLSLAFQPNPDPTQNSSSPKPSTIKAAL